MAARQRRRTDSCRHSLCWNYAAGRYPHIERHVLRSGLGSQRRRLLLSAATLMSHRVLAACTVDSPKVKQLARTSRQCRWRYSRLAACALWRKVLLSFFCWRSPNTVGACQLSRRALRPLAANAAGLESRTDVLIDRYRDGEKRGLQRAVAKAAILVDGGALPRWRSQPA